MKIYQAIYESDGNSRKENGDTFTEVKESRVFFCANGIKEAFDRASYYMPEDIYELVSISRVIDSVVYVDGEI